MLTLKKDGSVIKTEWVYDEKLDEGNYVDEDITSSAPMHMMEVCQLDPDVTLKSIFNFLGWHVGLFTQIIPGLTMLLEESKNVLHQQDLKYLELYWSFDVHENNFEGLQFPNLHGWGEDETPYSIMCLSVGELLDIPLKLLDKFDIIVYNPDTVDYSTTTYKNPSYTLWQIIYAVCWELTWIGTYKEKQEMLNHLNEEMERCKEEHGQSQTNF